MPTGAAGHSTLASFPPPPRIAFRRKGAPIPLRILGYCLIPHVWAGFFILYLVLLIPAMALFGHDETATVVSREIVNGKSRHTRVVYTFNDSGRVITDTASVSESRFGDFAPGTLVTVRTFLLGQSRTTRFPGDYSGPGMSIIPFALFWWAFLVGIFYLMVMRTLLQRRLVRIGEETRGNITGKSISKGKSTTYTISYSFRPRIGNQLSRKMNVDRSDYELANVNDKVVVLFDPASPKRSLLYRYSQYGARDQFGMEVPAGVA